MEGNKRYFVYKDTKKISLRMRALSKKRVKKRVKKREKESMGNSNVSSRWMLREREEENE